MFYIYKIYIFFFFKLTLLMLLVSSLDVFDCCGLELGGECSHPDPNKEEDGRRDSGTIFLSFLGRPGSPPLPRNMRGQGMGAHLACFWEHRQTQSCLVPSLYPKSNGQKDRRQVQGRGRWLCPGVRGASGHCCALGVPSACCMGILLPGALPGRSRRLVTFGYAHLLLRSPRGY